MRRFPVPLPPCSRHAGHELAARPLTAAPTHRGGTSKLGALCLGDASRPLLGTGWVGAASRTRLSARAMDP
eukprot:9491173-Pyramimonas_sp.AAC.1